MKRVLFAAAVIISFFSCAKKDMQPRLLNSELSAAATALELQPRIVNDKLNYPWEILWGPDDFIWFTEREGNVKKINPQTGEITTIAVIKEVASTNNYNGLLGMALHPDFKASPFVYVVYNYFGAKGKYLQKIVRLTYDGTTLKDPLTLVDSIVGKRGGNFIHNGSRLSIGPDLKLYATTGDDNRRYDFPQDPKFLNGKILRVNLDGSIPADNPYGNAVWSVGHRNAQGLAFANGKLYSSMHGETTDDEINIITGKGNYGWPFIEGYCDSANEQKFCDTLNAIAPIYAWTPTIAPSGLDYYNNDAIPAWKNSLLLAVLKDEKLLQLQLNADGSAIESTNEFFTGMFGRIRDVAVSPDGKVYICTDNGNNADMIVEIVSD